MNDLPDYRRALTGRTFSETTRDAGWAGWHYKRRGWASRLFWFFWLKGD